MGRTDSADCFSGTFPGVQQDDHLRLTRRCMETRDRVDQQHEHYMASFYPAVTDLASPQVQQQQDMAYSNSVQALSHLSPGEASGQQQQQQQHQPETSDGIDMDLLGSLMAMQGVQHANTQGQMSQAISSQPLSTAYNTHDQQQQTPINTSNPTPATLLEQQFKLSQLQQLQQLQNQIFQQQIALISQGRQLNELGSFDSPVDRVPPMHGLPTPGSSAELRPQSSVDFVSPMNLQYNGSQDSHFHAAHNGIHGSFGHVTGSASAPANLVFRANEDMDFDISPLTSPWLGAQHQHHSLHHQLQLQHAQHAHAQHQLHHQQPHQQIQRQLQVQHTQDRAKKRTASPDDRNDDTGADEPARKKHSPAVKPTLPNANGGAITPLPRRRQASGSKSTGSTPLLRSMSTRSIHGQTAANSIGGGNSNNSASSSNLVSPQESNVDPSTLMPPPTNSPQHYGSDDLLLTPVTPASIMNLGRMGLDQQPNLKKDGRPKTGTARTRGSIDSGKKNTSKRNSIVDSSNGDGPPRKTSHKAAEQKRRDSLKTTFDDLRLLLPPIPLPSDENFPDDGPILPGALPPRGPPKAGGEGPNKGVSKLQLLRCGNDYIRQLKARVERRDEELDDLRREIMRMRGYVSEEAWVGEGGLMVDLNRDLDEGEVQTMFRRNDDDDDELE